jgi:hypothetical protein
MTFYEDPNARDVNPYVREPAREKDSKTFEQETLTIIDHLDPDKHWIGEGLPAAGNDTALSAGYGSHIGTSPFPARADHQHDFTTYFSFYGQFASQVCVPGQTFLNGFLHAGGTNMLAPASSQVFIPPWPGNWEWHFLLQVDRTVAGNFVGECNIVAFFNNGTSNRIIWRDSMNGIPDTRIIDCWEVAFAVPSVAPTTNIQFAIQHNDPGANYLVTIHYLRMRRAEDWVSA